MAWLMLLLPLWHHQQSATNASVFTFLRMPGAFQNADRAGAATINLLHFALPQGTLSGYQGGMGVVKLGCMLEVMS